VIEGLVALGERFQLGLVTDGYPPGQRAKVHALGLDGVFEVEVYSDEFGREHRKPDPLPFLTALEQLGVDASDAMFVGDRPGKDVKGARAVGMQAIRVRTGEHASEWCGVPGVAVVDNATDAFDLLLGVTKWSPRSAG
jgi:putative hydrolase of the HAD superfamily